ncbi:thioesterase domain-containing protein [Azotobacter vinelandii]
MKHQAQWSKNYTSLIREQQKEGPYHLLGWSLGGALSILIARELEHQGQQVNFFRIGRQFCNSRQEKARIESGKKRAL